MGALKDYDDFHKRMNWCLECHGKGFKRVEAGYRDYNNRYHRLDDKVKCKKCGGSGKFTN